MLMTCSFNDQKPEPVTFLIFFCRYPVDQTFAAGNRVFDLADKHIGLQADMDIDRSFFMFEPAYGFDGVVDQIHQHADDRIRIKINLGRNGGDDRKVDFLFFHEKRFINYRQEDSHLYRWEMNC